MELDFATDAGPVTGPVLEVVSRLLDDSQCDEIIKSHRKHLPEIIQHAGDLVSSVSQADKALHRKFVIVCSKLLLYNTFLKQHIEPWLCKLGAPWSSPSEPSKKKSKLDPGVENVVLAACHNLGIRFLFRHSCTYNDNIPF